VKARIALFFAPPLLVLALLLGLVLAGGAIFANGTTASGVCGGGAAYGTGAIAWPMSAGSYKVSSGYGPRGGAFHAGLDLAAPKGTPIFAAADGVVAESKGPGGPGLPGTVGGFESWVVLDHTIDGQKVSTVYGHVDTYSVRPGDTVTAGQQIATVGNRGQSTGPHLHFEVWNGGRLSGGRSTDPQGWLAANVRPGEATTPAPAPAGGDTQLGPDTTTGKQSTLSLGSEQQRNAEIIVGVVKGRGLPLRAAVLAIATAMQESGLRNIDYGDRDSLGLFQQRPSQGWGTPVQILDPVYSTGKFLDGLVEVPGWDTGQLTQIIQRVQRSGFPLAYAKWEQQAQQLVAAAAGVDPITSGSGAAPSAC
jgi:murein DD-endopeptidase MepM/ murein hydrolase activator NlpD